MMEFRSDYTLTITAIEGIMTVDYALHNGNTLRISNGQGQTTDMPIRIERNRFTITARGINVVYNRIR